METDSGSWKPYFLPHFDRMIYSFHMRKSIESLETIFLFIHIHCFFFKKKKKRYFLIDHKNLTYKPQQVVRMAKIESARLQPNLGRYCVTLPILSTIRQPELFPKSNLKLLNWTSRLFKFFHYKSYHLFQHYKICGNISIGWKFQLHIISLLWS